MDTNLLSNIHKLFSERIDIFSSVEFNKVSRENRTVINHQSWSITGIWLIIHLSAGVGDDRNHQNQPQDLPGVCATANVWTIWTAADPGRLSLPPDVSVAFCLRWKPCALPAGRDSGELSPSLPGPRPHGAECDWSHLWERLMLIKHYLLYDSYICF